MHDVKLSCRPRFEGSKGPVNIMTNYEENAIEELNDEQLAEVTGGWGWGGESSRTSIGLGVGLGISSSSSEY
jgi:bacteriocin-like protein